MADDNVILAAVDCEQGSDTDFARSLPYNVTAYPTILYYQRGKLQFPYNHGHKKESDSDCTQFIDRIIMAITNSLLAIQMGNSV